MVGPQASPRRTRPAHPQARVIAARFPARRWTDDRHVAPVIVIQREPKRSKDLDSPDSYGPSRFIDCLGSLGTTCYAKTEEARVVSFPPFVVPRSDAATGCVRAITVECQAGNHLGNFPGDARTLADRRTNCSQSQSARRTGRRREKRSLVVQCAGEGTPANLCDAPEANERVMLPVRVSPPHDAKPQPRRPRCRFD
jgi:hypothetical protein